MEKFIVKVIIERVEREEVKPVTGCRCGGTCSRCTGSKPNVDRKVDTVAAVTVTAENLDKAITKAKAHLDAEVA